MIDELKSKRKKVILIISTNWNQTNQLAGRFYTELLRDYETARVVKLNSDSFMRDWLTGHN